MCADCGDNDVFEDPAIQEEEVQSGRFMLLLHKYKEQSWKEVFQKKYNIVDNFLYIAK